jgi:hypothetical protein
MKVKCVVCVIKLYTFLSLNFVMCIERCVISILCARISFHWITVDKEKRSEDSLLTNPNLVTGKSCICVV